MTLTKSYGKLVDWGIVTVVIFAVMIFGAVFIGKTYEVGDSILETDNNASTSNTAQEGISNATGDYFLASGELSSVAVTVIGFVILAVLLILLFYFIRALKKGGDGEVGDIL